MSQWLLRDQTAKSGEFLARTRAALINQAVGRLLATNPVPTAAERAQCLNFIQRPDEWAARFAQLIASYAPGFGTGTGTNANGDPAPNTTNGDLALTALVNAAWGKFFTDV